MGDSDPEDEVRGGVQRAIFCQIPCVVPRLGEKVFTFVSHCLSVYKLSNEMLTPQGHEEISFLLIKSLGHVWIKVQ